MDLYKAAERLMGMDREVWRRHANPWSVWTRVLTPLPLLALAIWSRAWLGWGALVPVALVVAWVWLNPRVFPPPAHFDSWAARGVLGERVWLHHPAAVAAHHRSAARLLALVSASGLAPFGWGLWAYDIGAVLVGILLIAGGKLWFVDRMAWIWADWRTEGRGEADLDAQ
jgi:hypothetical protein